MRVLRCRCCPFNWYLLLRRDRSAPLAADRKGPAASCSRARGRGAGLGIVAGMSLRQVPASFTAGVGNLMGHIAIVLGLGAILGRLLASSGGAAALSGTLVEKCGERGLPWALLGLGIIVGMPVFFEVGLVLMMPIVAATARAAHALRWSEYRCWLEPLHRAWHSSASSCGDAGCNAIPR